jgi:peptidoglycan/LPS O-acetylase OafA/YrhL
MKRKRLYWMDCMKGIAILSVVVSHTSYFLGGYLEHKVSASVWSQVVFPFYWFYGIVGMTVWMSMRRIMASGSKNFLVQAAAFWKKRLWYVLLYILGGLFLYYVLPSPTYSVVSFADFFLRLEKFSVQPPHHFFLTLFQFMLVGPFVVWAVSKMRNIWVYILSVGVVALILTPLSRTLYYPIFAMPRPLYVGGWAFMIFYLGVGYMKFAQQLSGFEVPIGVAAAVGALTYLGVTHTAMPTQQITLPIILWFIATFFLMKAFITRTEKRRHFWNIFSFLGKYSWIIYILHWSILEFCTKWPQSYTFLSPLGVITLITLAITVPVGLGLVFTKKTVYRLREAIS